MIQLNDSNDQVLRRQQQTGMCWQEFILTEILPKHLEKRGDRYIHYSYSALLPQGISLTLASLI